MIVIGDMLGVPPEDRDKLLRWSDDMLGSLSGDARGDRGRGDRLHRVRRLRAGDDRDRRREPTDDLVSVLVHAEIDGDRLDDDEIMFESLLLLVGGDETTRHVISGGMEQLLRHPDERRKLIDDPAQLPTAVEEMLRWVSPIKNMTRTVTRDVELGGRALRAGEKLLLLYESANFDDAHFDEPDRFDVERAPNDHLAFGFGPHFCLGASLARLELQTMFARVLERLPDLELADPAADLPRPSAPSPPSRCGSPRPLRCGASRTPGVEHRRRTACQVGRSTVIASVDVADVGKGAALGVVRKAPSPEKALGLRQANVALTAPLAAPSVPSPTSVASAWSPSGTTTPRRPVPRERPDGQKLVDGWRVRLDPIRMHGSWPGLPTTSRSSGGRPRRTGRGPHPRPREGAPRSSRSSAPARRPKARCWCARAHLGDRHGEAAVRLDLLPVGSRATRSELRLRRRMPEHPAPIAVDHAHPFHHQSAFIRFRPYGSEGKLDGRNPLAERWMASA